MKSDYSSLDIEPGKVCIHKTNHKKHFVIIGFDIIHGGNVMIIQIIPLGFSNWRFVRVKEYEFRKFHELFNLL